MKNKALHTVLGIICLFVFTPVVSFILTSQASNFEGANGFAFLYLLPVIFIGLAILWLIDYQLFSKKRQNYFISRNIIFLLLSTMSLLGCYLYFLHEEKERKELRLNSYHCVEQLKDGYEGFIIAIRFQTLRIRKKDSAYTQLKYTFKNEYDMNEHFYVGQRIWKTKNEKEFWVELKDGKTQRFYVPCYVD
ncbi:hypothetical protein [Aquimarina sp. AU474]|uniref:hypothetical protein n=1 Tax=Aquimarina sp. AU474 TaxID=2108529 RepID=UPI000D6905E7|nr:hypothetical protein [Aquimarina sp. AU474]